MNTKQLGIVLSVLFFITSFLVILVKLVGHPDLENIFKPSLLLILMFWYFMDRFVSAAMVNWGFMLALFFSLLGDVFLMPAFDNFILGLVFFLLSHLFYIAVFLSKSKGQIGQYLKQGWLFALIVFSVYLGLLLRLMSSVAKLHSTVLLIAVPLYATVLLAMVLAAFVYSKKYYYAQGIFIMIGGLLFLFSDGVLALNKFSFEVPYSPIWVMGSYVLAQWFLVYGFLKSSKA